MRTTRLWLTGVILLAIAAFLVVFQPVTFSPRKDPSDASRYLRSLGTRDFNPNKPPDRFWDLPGGRGGIYLYVPQHDLKLGLDLRGGMRVVLRIPDRAMFDYRLKQALKPSEVADMQQAVVKALSAEDMLGPDASDPRKIQVLLSEKEAQIITRPKDEEEAKYQLARISAAMGTVFKGEDSFIAPKPDQVFHAADPDDGQSVLKIMQERVNRLGLAEVQGYTKGQNQVVLEIPGVKDPDRVLDIITPAAQMEFRLIPSNIRVDTDRDTGEEAAVNTITGEELTPEQAVQQSQLVLRGADLEPTSSVIADRAGKPAVGFRMRKGEARKKFGNITAANKGRQLAIVLDGKIITAPVIKAHIPDNGIIEGSFTMQEAQDLAIKMNAGALPVPVEVAENRTMSATLGADSVALSLKAGLIGLVAVLVFMFAYYRLPGLMANVALIIYIVLSLAVLWSFQATLTLPGIAGIIISIGMAVDANVIIFERLKEELRTRKPLESAIDVAFARAWTAILDSNVASLITGAVLLWLGTGPVKGFAITLMIGVAVSMFTAITITRLFMKLMIRSKAGHNMAWYGV